MLIHALQSHTAQLISTHDRKLRSVTNATASALGQSLPIGLEACPLLQVGTITTNPVIDQLRDLATTWGCASMASHMSNGLKISLWPTRKTSPSIGCSSWQCLPSLGYLKLLGHSTRGPILLCLGLRQQHAMDVRKDTT